MAATAVVTLAVGCGSAEHGSAADQMPAQCNSISINYPTEHPEQEKAKKVAACVNAYGIVRDFVVDHPVNTEPVIVPKFGIDPSSLDGSDVEDPARVQVTTQHEPGHPFVLAWFRHSADGNADYSQLNSLKVLVPDEEGKHDVVYAREQWTPENWTAYSTIDGASVNFMMGCLQRPGQPRDCGSAESVNTAFAAARSKLQAQ
jgi:hypothetical protein